MRTLERVRLVNDATALLHNPLRVNTLEVAVDVVVGLAAPPPTLIEHVSKRFQGVRGQRRSEFRYESRMHAPDLPYRETGGTCHGSTTVIGGVVRSTRRVAPIDLACPVAAK